MIIIRLGIAILGISWLLLLGTGIGMAEEAENTVPGLKYGSPETFAEFHGFVNLLYTDFEKDGDRNSRGDSSFDQHYFYFNASAKVRHNVKVLGSIEYEHGGEEIFIDQAYIDWSIYNQYLFLRLGKFYSPFGFELQEYQYPIRKLVSRPLMARNLLFNEWTDTGLHAYGQLSLPFKIPAAPLWINYDLAVVNGPNGSDGSSDTDTTPEILEVGTGSNPNIGGTGDARQNRDNNSDRTFIGRLSTDIPGIMEVGISYATGRYSDSGSPGLDFSLIGADMNTGIMGLELQAEFVKREIDVSTSSQQDSYGYYIQSSYKLVFGKEMFYYIEPVVRYDFLNPGDPSAAQDDRERYSVGVNYSPYPHFKVGSEWQINNERGTEKKDNGFLLQAVVDF